MTRNSNRNESAATFPSIDDIAGRLDRLREVEQPRHRRLWAYYRNPMRVVGRGAGDQHRPYRQAQEWGLPSRITGASSGGDILLAEPSDNIARKEVVIENDIGWRVETMVDYLFGRPLVIQSAAPDPQRREQISALLRQIIAHNGGILFLQQLALLGAVHGFVDVLVKFCGDDGAMTTTSASDATACPTRELGAPPAGQEPPHADDGGASGGGVDGNGDDAPHEAEPAPGTEAASPAAASDDDESGARAASTHSRGRLIERLARMVRLEIVEPARVLPFLSATDYREVTAYGQVFEVVCGEARDAAGGAKLSWFDRIRRLTSRNPLAPSPQSNLIIELITQDAWRRYENGKVVTQGDNSLERIPLVHIQNTAVPFAYSGGSDVEPLIPLQDELNTRMSDRANRISLQSFKMYLGKHIENFDALPIAPGRMWVSDNSDAQVIEFGGDGSCPSEDAHLSDIREAIDKTSGVTPIAAGAIKGRIGRLTSAVALRVTLQALLAKTEKKRTTYGAAIAQMCELSLAWLDRAGLFATTPDERQIEINWPSPLPTNELEKLTEAEAKARLGVSKEIVLRELGY